MPITTTRIDIPYPETPALSLLMRLGPCRVRLATADQPSWVTGTYDDPSDVLPLEVRSEGGVAIVSQRFDLGRGIGTVSPPLLDLSLGRGRPFALTMEVGAGDHSIDLGGVPLTALTVRAGAGRYTLDLSSPNPAEMTMLEIAAGAGEVTLKRLANANAAEGRVSGGVGRCVLELGGELRRDMRMRIDAGFAGLEIGVPATTPARVTAKAFAAAVDVVGPLTRTGNVISTEPGAAGKTPAIAAEVTIAFGALLVRAT